MDSPDQQQHSLSMPAGFHRTCQVSGTSIKPLTYYTRTYLYVPSLALRATVPQFLVRTPLPSACFCSFLLVVFTQRHDLYSRVKRSASQKVVRLYTRYTSCSSSMKSISENLGLFASGQITKRPSGFLRVRRPVKEQPAQGLVQQTQPRDWACFILVYAYSYLNTIG